MQSNVSLRFLTDSVKFSALLPSESQDATRRKPAKLGTNNCKILGSKAVKFDIETGASRKAVKIEGV